MNVATELEKLQQLRESGAIDDQEFAAAKSRILNGQAGNYGSPPPLPFGSAMSLAEQEQQTRMWGLILHLSIFAGYAVPIAGLVAPIIIWQLKKDELPQIDAHGKNAINWIISHIIYLAVSIVLFFVLIGIPMLIALGVVSIVFPIVAAIRANKGEVWRYPLSITFFS